MLDIDDELLSTTGQLVAHRAHWSLNNHFELKRSIKVPSQTTDGIVAMVALTVSNYPGEQTFDVSNNVSELTLSIDSRTFRQVHDLEVSQDANRVVLRGRSGSYYVKQLATHAVMDLMPGVKVDNCIAVTR